MKRYYFKKNETEIARLKMDLFYYAKTMGYDYVCDENDAIWAKYAKTKIATEVQLLLFVKHYMKVLLLKWELLTGSTKINQ